MIPMDKDQKKVYDIDEAREKIRAFCAYRERSQREVSDKLYEYGFYEETRNELISELIQENFLNEERFARAYVRGKFRIKHWGRKKIEQGLFYHQLSDYVMRKAFSEIPENEYLQTLEQVIEKSWRNTRLKDSFQRKGKVASYAIRRGFEPELVWEVLKGY